MISIPMPTRRSSKPAAPDFSARVARCLAALAKLAPDARYLLVTNPRDVGYLTGFLGGDSYLLVGAGKPVIISDFRYQEELEPLASWCSIVIRKGAMLPSVAEVLNNRGSQGAVAIQADHLTVSARSAMAKLAPKVPLIDCSGVVAGLRAIKDDFEVAMLRKAIAIQQESMLATLPQIGRALSKNKGKGSITEAEIAAILEREMKMRGSARPSFETIVAARAKGSLPHYRPGNIKLTRNQPLLIDWGATWAGYHGDMTRTFCFGNWPRKIAKIYAIVHEAHQVAAAALAPGKTTFEIDKLARDHIAAAGFGEYFGHGLGHGIGLDIHEDPRLSHMTEGVTLQPGHVVTIEPGIYLPGVGGVRLENDYLVTTTGCMNLCSLPMGFDWATR